MRTILLIATLATLVLAGCAAPDESDDGSDRGTDTGQNGSGREVSGNVTAVGNDTNSTAEENTTSNETAETP